MTKIEEIEQKLNECQKALAELKESKKEGKWKPDFNEEYWFRNDEGTIVYCIYNGYVADTWRYNNTPLFITEEECKRYWHFMDTVKEKGYEFSKEEWEDEEIDKFVLHYNYKTKEFGVISMWLNKYLGEIFFKTEEDAQYIIDNFKEELMTYWL